jgi:hypothetical protein
VLERVTVTYLTQQVAALNELFLRIQTRRSSTSLSSA